MQISKTLQSQSGIQYQGVADKSEADPRDGLLNAIMTGQFKRGRFDKSFKVTKANLRAKLGYDPKNPDYVAVEDMLNAGAPYVWVQRIVKAKKWNVQYTIISTGEVVQKYVDSSIVSAALIDPEYANLSTPELKTSYSALVEDRTDLILKGFDDVVSSVEQNVPVFADWVNLTNITIDKCLSVNENVFLYCGNVEKLTLTEGLKYIGPLAFMGFYKCKVCRIPNSTTTIMADAFSGWDAGEELYIGNGLQVIGPSPEITSKQFSNFGGTGSSCKLRILHIGRGVKFIGDYAFQQKNSVTDFKLSSTVLEHIGDYAFQELGKNSGTVDEDSGTLTGQQNAFGVAFPATLTYIGLSAFQYACIQFIEINANPALEIKYAAFGWTTAERLTVQGTIKSTDGAFTYSMLSDIDLGGGIATMGNDTFLHCLNIKSLHIPGGTKRIEGSNSLGNLENLEQITFAEGLEYIGQSFGAMSDKITQIIFPNSLKECHAGLSSGTALQNIVFGNSLEILTSYTSPAMDSDGNQIPQNIYMGTPYSKLTDKSAPQFAVTPATTIYLPKSSLADYMASSWTGSMREAVVGYDVPSTASIPVIPELAPANTSDPWSLQYTNMMTGQVVQVYFADGYIPDGYLAGSDAMVDDVIINAKTVGNGSFGGKGSIKRIKLMEGVENIVSSAFAGATLRVKKLALPNSLKRIGGGGFVPLMSLAEWNWTGENFVSIAGDAMISGPAGFVPPAAKAPPSPVISTATTAKISGTAEILIKGKIQGSIKRAGAAVQAIDVSVDGTGAWTFTPTQALQVGDSVEINYIDLVLNTSAKVTRAIA